MNITTLAITLWVMTTRTHEEDALGTPPRDDLTAEQWREHRREHARRLLQDWARLPQVERDSWIELASLAWTRADLLAQVGGMRGAKVPPEEQDTGA